MGQLIRRETAIIDEILPGKGVLRDFMLVMAFSYFTSLCSLISFWIGPVPITGQTFAVLLSGAALGSRRGALSQVSYLIIGATGMPFWFALGGPIGIARLIGPTAGYLYGFVATAFVVGFLTDMGWDRKLYLSLSAMLAGEIVLYVFGLSWLSAYIPSAKLLQVGLFPFIAGDLVKIVAAAALLPSSWIIIKSSKNIIKRAN